jgi:hypothetical protein
VDCADVEVVDVISVQGPPAVPVYPTLHMQFCTDVLASVEWELAGHTEHTSELLKEYLPAVQTVQTVALSREEYVPAAQSIQTSAPA